MPGRWKILTREHGERIWQAHGICPHYTQDQAEWWKRHLERNTDKEVKIVRMA